MQKKKKEFLSTEEEKKEFLNKNNAYKSKKGCYYLFKLKYQIKKGEKVLKLFGKYFVGRNKLNCKIIYNNRIYEIKEYLDDIDKYYKTKDSISIKLRFTNNFINAREMFHKCNCLLSISDTFIMNNSDD